MSTTAQQGTGFAGIPSQSTPEGITPVGERTYTEFTIPESCLGVEWTASGFGEKDRTFGMTEITPAQEQRAGKLAGATMDFGTVYTEQQKMTIYVIGGKKTNNQHDLLTRWFAAIGPKGRKIVEMCYSEINSIEQSEGSAVAAAGRPKRL